MMIASATWLTFNWILEFHGRRNCIANIKFEVMLGRVFILLRKKFRKEVYGTGRRVRSEKI